MRRPVYGFKELDRLCRMRSGNLVILASRPSMGKTSLACHAAIETGRDTRVLYMTLEESETELTHRLMAIESKVITLYYRKGRLMIGVLMDVNSETGQFMLMGS